MVSVGPPLLAKPAGSSSGFVLLREVPEKPQEPSSAMLWPPSITLAQLPPEQLIPQLKPVELLARIVLVSVSVPALQMPPP